MRIRVVGNCYSSNDSKSNIRALKIPPMPIVENPAHSNSFSIRLDQCGYIHGNFSYCKNLNATGENGSQENINFRLFSNHSQGWTGCSRIVCKRSRGNPESPSGISKKNCPSSLFYSRPSPVKIGHEKTYSF